MTQSVTSYIYCPSTGPGGLFFVDSLLACLAFRRVGEHTSLYWQYGTHQAAALLRAISSRASTPRYIPFCVLPWSQPDLARRSGVPGDV